MSDKNKNIDDLIRKGFDSSDKDFDFSSWSDVEEKLDQQDELDSLIVSAYEQTNEDVPIETWDNIDESLDIDTVWNRISKNLDKHRHAFAWWNVAAIGLLLLLLGSLAQSDYINEGFDYEIVNQQENQNNEAISNVEIQSQPTVVENNLKTFNSNTVQIANKHNASASELNHFQFNNKNNVEVSYNSELTNDENIYFVVNESTGNSSDTTVFEKNKSDLINLLNQPTISRINHSNTPKNFPPIEINPDQNEKPLKNKRWVIGAFGTVDNSFISDAISRQGFSANSLIKNKFLLSAGYGLYGQVYLKNSLIISSEFYWNSTAQREVLLYRKLRYTEDKLKLDYYKYTAALGKSIKVGAKNHGNSFITSIGGFVSYLKNSQAYIGKDLTDDNTPHKQWNYGLNLKLGYQKELNNWILGTGLHSEVGLNNTFKGTENQSSALNFTRTFTNGLYFRIGYKL